MSVVSPPTITALPTPPDPNDRATFNTRAYPWSVAQQTFGTQVGLVASNVYSNANEALGQANNAAASAIAATNNGAAQVALATTQANNAAASAVAATNNGAAQVALAAQAAAISAASANYKGLWSALTGALNMPASVSHNNVFWALNNPLADVTAAIPGISAAWTQISVGGIKRVARASNTQLTSADASKIISMTGTWTQTFAGAAALGDGWFCYLQNNGTGDITLDPNASELIDGLTSYIMYPGEVRLVQCDGVALTSIILQSFLKTYAASAAWVRPPGYQYFDALIWGGGGGGGGNYGYGGGGGACTALHIPAAAAVGVCIIGAGGAQSVSGGNTVLFGYTAYGGAAGSNSVAGGGGGIYGAGSNQNGGNPYNNNPFGGGNANVDSVWGGGGGTAVTTAAGGRSMWGGGGGGNYGGASAPGGTSIFGGAGGSTTVPAAAPAGGGWGGAGSGVGTTGGRGEARIWGII